MLETRPGRLSGIITLVMIWKGVAPMLWAASMTPASSSRRLVSTSRATKGKEATTRGTMVALVPTVVADDQPGEGEHADHQDQEGDAAQDVDDDVQPVHQPAGQRQNAVLVPGHQKHAQGQPQHQGKRGGEHRDIKGLPHGKSEIIDGHRPDTSSTVTPGWAFI